MPLQGPKKKTVDARKGGVPDPGLQPSLFEVEPQGEGIPGGLDNCQAAEPAEARAVDLKGANEYGLPTQMPLPEATGLPEREGGAPEAIAVEGNQDSREEATGIDQGPKPFLKLIARIAMRAGQKPTSKEGGSK